VSYFALIRLDFESDFGTNFDGSQISSRAASTASQEEKTDVAEIPHDNNVLHSLVMVTCYSYFLPF
jgi:hypothetical protein